MGRRSDEHVPRLGTRSVPSLLFDTTFLDAHYLGAGDITVDISNTFLVSCTGVSNFYVREWVFKGDAYGTGHAVFPISLPKGTHTFYVPFTGSEAASFSCNIQPANA